MSKFGIGSAHPGGLHLTKNLLKGENIDHNSVILDVGCGTGRTAAYLAKKYGATVIGMDINPIMIEKAKLRNQSHSLPLTFILGSVEQSPFQDETFDIILSESVLSFVHKSKALGEIFRLLKRGGRFIGNELTSNQPLNTKNELEIKQFYGLDSVPLEQDWLSLLEVSGFQQIRMKRPALSQNQTLPDFQFSESIEPEFYQILLQHQYMMKKYEGILDYRVFTCTK